MADENKSNTTNEAACVCVGLFLGVILSSIIWVVGICYVDHNWRMEAIKHGAGEYVISDPATGQTVWRWKGATKTTEEK